MVEDLPSTNFDEFYDNLCLYTIYKTVQNNQGKILVIVNTKYYIDTI